MQIDISDLSDADLIKLIKSAADELTRRTSTQVQHIKSEPRIVKVQQPDPADEDFALRLITKMRRGDHIKADERQRAAEIARKFPDWAVMHGLPRSSTTGPWRKAREYYAADRYDPTKR